MLLKNFKKYVFLVFAYSRHLGEKIHSNFTCILPQSMLKLNQMACWRERSGILLGAMGILRKCLRLVVLSEV